MKLQHNAGLNLVEALVILTVVIVLAFCLLPSGTTTTLKKGEMTQSLSNMKQLQLATQRMALDGLITGKTNLGWPGDTGGTFSNWAREVVQGGYVTKADFAAMLSAPGIRISPAQIPTDNTAALLVYAVKEDSAGETVFLTTANFTNTPAGGITPLPSAKPYGKKGFIVFRKGGDGIILRSSQTGPRNTNLIGTFAPLCK